MKSHFLHGLIFIWVSVFELFNTEAFAQLDGSTKKRVFQFSVLPGFGTNGIQPGRFENKFSINLFSGYSAANLWFECSLISNLNTNTTQGLQLSGLVNITGANSFVGLSLKEIDQKKKKGFVSSVTGVQISGLANVVTGDVFGAQLSGGININGGSLAGCQLSLVSNYSYHDCVGFQGSGLLNIAKNSMYGVQICGLSNMTEGSLSGIQMAPINKAGDIDGKNSVGDKLPSGFQCGIVNIAKQMNGYQLGLLNIAKRSQGTQIGLINIYKKGTLSKTKDGTAIGLLNIGSLDYVAIYVSDFFKLNWEVSTGNKKNGRISSDNRNVYVTNALIYSHGPFNGVGNGFGYGLKKLIFNRSSLPGMAESRFIGYGLDAQFIKFKPNETTAENTGFLTRLKLIAGKRLAPKLFGFNVFAAISFNAYWTDSKNFPYQGISNNSKMGSYYVQYWPGASIGLLLH